MSDAYRGRSTQRTLFRFKVAGHLFGLFAWSRVKGAWTPIRDGGLGLERRGAVLRVGPLGHVQVSEKLHRWQNGRRNLRVYGIHFWGVRGRRRKRGLAVEVFW